MSLYCEYTKCQCILKWLVLYYVNFTSIIKNLIYKVKIIQMQNVTSTLHLQELLISNRFKLYFFKFIFSSWMERWTTTVWIQKFFSKINFLTEICFISKINYSAIKVLALVLKLMYIYISIHIHWKCERSEIIF